MNIKQAIFNATKILKNNQIDDANMISKILMSYVLKKTREYLIINDKEELTIENEQKYWKNIEKVANGYPIQYITHQQEFMKLDFYVDDNVLIPQPDTEILVEEAIKRCNGNEKILDLCTGSGAIAISLAVNIDRAKITASDISKKALEIAEKNAVRNNVKVNFIESNLFEKIEGKFNIIVSNPPYIESKVIDELSKDVQCEPKLALDGGEDGLDFYRKIVIEAPRFLKDKGHLIMEIGFDQKKKVMELLNKTQKFENIECVKDLSGNDRVICARLI